jgi:hypothetical protein
MVHVARGSRKQEEEEKNRALIYKPSGLHKTAPEREVNMMMRTSEAQHYNLTRRSPILKHYNVKRILERQIDRYARERLASSPLPTSSKPAMAPRSPLWGAVPPAPASEFELSGATAEEGLAAFKQAAAVINDNEDPMHLEGVRFVVGNVSVLQAKLSFYQSTTWAYIALTQCSGDAYDDGVKFKPTGILGWYLVREGPAASLTLLFKWPPSRRWAKNDYPASIKEAILRYKIVTISTPPAVFFTMDDTIAVSLVNNWEEWRKHFVHKNALLGTSGQARSRAELDDDLAEYTQQDLDDEAAAEKAHAERYLNNLPWERLEVADKLSLVSMSRERQRRFQSGEGTNTCCCVFCGEQLYISHEVNESVGGGESKRVVYVTAALRHVEGNKKHLECECMEMMMGREKWGKDASEPMPGFDDDDEEDEVPLEDLEDDDQPS